MVPVHQCTYFPALEKVDPPPVLKVPAISIKEESEDETEEVSIKEEPFLYGNEVGRVEAQINV